MQITKIIEWDMGHRLLNHKSKCRNLHGHRYVAHITMQGDIITEKGISEEGMIIDFSDIKKIATDFIDTNRDHGYMFQTGDQIGTIANQLNMKIYEVPFVPTAENVVKHLFEVLYPLFNDVYGTNLCLHSITLYETPKSYVLYQP